jgi:Fic family protein
MARDGLLEKIEEYQRTINGYRPFEGDTLAQVRAYYRVGLVYTSNALEGFTYTESETKVLLEDGLTAGGKPLKDAYAVLGHAKAYDHMFSLLRADGISEEDILRFHALLEGSLENDALAGQYRTGQSFISGSKYPVANPESIAQAMREFFQFVKKTRLNEHPALLAAQAHKKLVFIHPFADGNGRVARLTMNTLLIQKGYLPAIIPLILRSEYIAALEAAHSEDAAFVEFILQREIETQKEMIRLLEGRI